jgi:serine/threonine-protein kinase
LSSARSGPRTVGRYVVFGEIASGGMASVCFGRLTGLAGFTRPVAVKRLHPHYARDPEFVQGFVEEARLASRIVHPNVVATLDVVSNDDELLLVMEYVRGASLAQITRALRLRGEPMPPAIAAGIAAGILHGLHAAHEAKDPRGRSLDIVHRDVSPQNVLVGADGIARVLDFGIAKAAGRLQTTQQGQLKGKLAYVAPEQLGGALATRRTDIYAASVVLWEILSGERLFKGETEASILARVLRGDPPAPSTLAPDLPPAFDRVVLRGLASEPSARYETAHEMAQDLEASVRVASAGEIGDWVERVASRELEERARRIADIERDAADGAVPSSLASMVTPTAPEARAPLASRTEVDSPARRATRPWVGVWVFGLAALIGGGATAIVMVRSEGPAQAPASEPPAAEVLPDASASAGPSASAPPSASASVSPPPRPRASAAPRRAPTR